MIKIFSIYTRDILLDKQDNKIRTQDGGPLFYIEKVLMKNGVEYQSFAQEAEIFINVLKNNEQGKLKTKLSQKKINNINKDDIVIVSTVDREWIFGKKVHPKAFIFMDIQGYVRAGNVKEFFSRNNLPDNVYCMKGNEEEIGKLPRNILENQKKKMLIITRGARGVLVYFHNKKYEFIGKKIRSVNTIGAGDTFFANFIVTFLKTDGNIMESGNFAISKTEKFLLMKK